MATRAFLLCGDEKAVHVVSQILDELEVSFEHSSEPAFSLKRLAAQKFDLLIVDCDNVQNATQVFNSARASNLNKTSIAIAIVEGKAGVPSAFRLGASLVLTKPVSLEQTRNTLRTGVGMTRKDTPEAKAPASVMATAGPVPPAIPSAATKPAAAPTVVPVLAVRTPSAAPATVVAPVVASDATSKSSVSASPTQAKPAPVVPRPAAPALESKPAPPVIADTKPASAPAAQTTVKAAAAAAGAAPAKSNFDSIFTSSAVAEEPSQAKSDTKSSAKSAEDADLKRALDSPLKISASSVNDDNGDLDPDDDLGGPSFGGMSKLPFVGTEESTQSSSSRGWSIPVLVFVILGGSAYGAWATQPAFRNFVSWEYLNLASKISGTRGQAPASAPMHPVAQGAAAPAPAVTQPATGAAAAADPNATAANPAPAANANAATAPAGAEGNSPATADNATQKQPAIQSATQDTTPGHDGSNPSLVAASASVPGASAAKTTGSDLLEVPEDFADDQIVHRVHPAYPKQARARKLHGTVVLEAVVNKQGKVDSLQLVSGDPVLAQAAADAVKQWRYKPYLHNGDYTEFQTRVTVDFKEPQVLKTQR
jgi:protein TonB